MQVQEKVQQEAGDERADAGVARVGVQEYAIHDVQVEEQE